MTLNGKSAVQAVFSIIFAVMAAFTPFVVCADDAVVDSLVVAGIDSTMADEARTLLLSRQDGVLNDGLIEHDVAALVSFMQEKGWWAAEVTAGVDTVRTGGAMVTYRIEAGNPVYFGLIRTVVADDGFDVASVGVPPQYSGLFEKKKLEDIIATVIDAISSAGYPKVAVTPSLAAVGDTVDVTLTIVPGIRATIDSIAVNGLTRTRDIVVQRELASLIGKPADTGTIDEAVAVLSRLTFIRTTGRPVVNYRENRSILEIGLEEGGQGVFDGVLGYQPKTVGSGGRMIGKIDVGLNNLFGTGRSGGFRWENLGESTEDLEVNYREPWLFGRPYNAAVSFAQEERGNRGYTRTVMTGTIGRNVGPLALETGFRYEKVSADSLNSSSGSGFEGSVVWTAVDNRLNPVRGFRYGVRWSTVAKRYRFGGRRATRVERVGIDLDNFLPVRARQTVALLVRYRRVSLPDTHLSASDRYWLGGATTIRGHDESMYPAVEVFWGSAEYRFLTGGGSRVFLFVDSGWLSDRVKRAGLYEDLSRYVTGYGFGLRVTSRAGILGFDYGLANGQGPGDGRLHVSMRTEF